MTPNSRWRGWSDLQFLDWVVPLAGPIVLMETLAAWAGVAWHPAGGVAVTPVLPAAVLLASLIGWRQLGFSKQQLRAWRGCVACTALLLVVVSAMFLERVGPPRALLSFFASATEEELVFRLAAPVFAGGATAYVLHRAPNDLKAWGTGPRVVALLVAGLAFGAGPGHLAQVGTHAWRMLPFVTTALLLTYVVLRTGNLVVGLLVHAVLNVATVCYLSGDISRDTWALLVIVVLLGFARGAERAGHRLGLMTPLALAGA